MSLTITKCIITRARSDGTAAAGDITFSDGKIYDFSRNNFDESWSFFTNRRRCGANELVMFKSKKRSALLENYLKTWDGTVHRIVIHVKF